MTRCLLLILALTILAHAQDSTWRRVVQKIQTAEDYQFRYRYEGPEGQFLFRYGVELKTPRIRTEVLEGSTRGAGTVIFYDAKESRDYVRMKTSFLTLRRSITAKDIADSSLYIPLYHQLLDKIGGAKLKRKKALPGGLTRYVFEDDQFVHWAVVGDQFELVEYRRFEGDSQLEKLTFSDISWNTQPTLKL